MDAIFFSFHPSFIVKKSPSNYVSTLNRIDIKALECFAVDQVDFGKKMLNAFNSS